VNIISYTSFFMCVLILILTSKAFAKVSASQAAKLISEERVSYKQTSQWIKVTQTQLKTDFSTLKSTLPQTCQNDMFSRGALKLRRRFTHTN